MLDLIKTIGATFSAFFKTRLALQVENAALRHQLIILRRASPRHLAEILRPYTAYYIQSRTHLSLAKDTPLPLSANENTSGRIVAIQAVGGQHHRYERPAA